MTAPSFEIDDLYVGAADGSQILTGVDVRIAYGEVSGSEAWR